MGTAQLDCTINWFFADGSTDYYNSCSPQGNMSVPYNVRGFQYAASGNAYIGMITYGLNEPAPPYYREPAMTKLTQTLSSGTKYYVSFKAVLTLNDFESCCASNKLGALFSKVPYSTTNKAPINNFAHVFTNSIISDTLNWTTVAGSFVSDSAYQYITIGNFFSSPNTSYIDYKGNFPQTSAAYYYIDDVKVSTDSTLVYAGINKHINENENFSFYPNPVETRLYVHCPRFENLIIKIVDTLGRTVLNSSLQKENSIDLAILTSGIYLAIIVDTKENKIIKTKKINKL
jgi:hypothetical protein